MIIPALSHCDQGLISSTLFNKINNPSCKVPHEPLLFKLPGVSNEKKVE